jgi:hypothetical protein
MAAAFVQVVTHQQGVGSPTLTTTGGNTTTSGNALIGLVGWPNFASNALSSFTDNNSNDWSTSIAASPVSISASNANASLYVAQNITGGSAPTFSATNSVSGGALSIIVIEVSGLKTSGAVRASASNLSTGFATSYPGASVAAGAGDFVGAFTVCNPGNPAQTFVQGGGMTIPANGALPGTGGATIPCAFQYASNVLAGTFTGAMTGNQFDQYCQIIVALEAAVAAISAGAGLLMGVG